MTTLATPAIAKPPAEELSFLSPTPKLDPRDATAVMRGSAVHVETNHGAEWPGVIFHPADGKPWNLDAFDRVDLTIRNAGRDPLRICLRIDNKGADGANHCIDNKTELAPGETQSISTKLLHMDVNSPIKLSAMRGTPMGIPGDKVFDASKVVMIGITLDHPTKNHVLEILDLRAAGRFNPAELAPADPKEFFPFIDQYGQYIHREWLGKVHSDADLKKSEQAEVKDIAANPGPKDWDEFGGWKSGPKLKATGYFYPTKYRSKWWLVDPAGHLFFSHGITCVNYWEGQTIIEGREKWFADLPAKSGSPADFYRKPDRVLFGPYKGKQPMGYDFAQANLYRKYGSDWQANYAEMAHRRLRSWGMNTIANWSDSGVFNQQKTPYTHQVWFDCKQLEGSEGYWGRFRDVFDPTFSKNLRAACKDQVKTDPWCLGYFIDNEMGWGDEISLAVASLVSPEGQAAKIEFVGDLKSKYTTIQKLNGAWGSEYASWDELLESRKAPDKTRARNDLLAFSQKFAETYFKGCRDAIKDVAPQMLYLGCRFDSRNEVATSAALKFCDVVSFNFYRRSLAAFEVPGDAPVMLSEFHFGALDRGMFHGGILWTMSQADRAAAYRQLVEQVVRHPNFVGSHWFKYQDEPTTGRPLDGENYQCGFLDVGDHPYPETIEASRAVGYSMYRTRSK